MAQLRPGDIAPDFAGSCSDGAERAVRDYRGAWLLLVFLRHFT